MSLLIMPKDDQEYIKYARQEKEKDIELIRGMDPELADKYANQEMLIDKAEKIRIRNEMKRSNKRQKTDNIEPANPQDGTQGAHNIDPDYLQKLLEGDNTGQSKGK